MTNRSHLIGRKMERLAFAIRLATPSTWGAKNIINSSFGTLPKDDVRRPFRSGKGRRLCSIRALFCRLHGCVKSILCGTAVVAFSPAPVLLGLQMWSLVISWAWPPILDSFTQFSTNSFGGSSVSLLKQENL